MPIETVSKNRVVKQRALKLASGDEAIAMAVQDAGARYAASYPGTPASDVLEALVETSAQTQIKCVWSVNEKVAYESALAVAMCGQRALVAMKHVGLNVAADAFISSCYSGVTGGLVLLVADDPGCHSSQNEQDSRHYCALAGTLLLEPADAQEAYTMTREAFKLSEQYRLPVMVRLTSRVAHGCSPVAASAAENRLAVPQWPKDPGHYLLVPTISRRLHRRLALLRSELEACIASLTCIITGDAPASKDAVGQGVICTGFGAALAREFASPACSILKIAGLPFEEMNLEKYFIGLTEVLVLEEGDPILEKLVRAKAPRGVRILGKLSGHLALTGELRPLEVSAALRGERAEAAHKSPLPSRLPEICQGCGYHKVFGALADISDLLTPSDIGCNTLGGLPPYEVMDANLAMGSSIGMACGLAGTGQKRVVAILGDSTFFHSGIPPLIEAVRQGLNFCVLLLDNGTTAMTGGQDVPHVPSPNSNMGVVDLLAIIRGIGVAECTVFDPHKLGRSGIKALIESRLDAGGIRVLVYRSPCLLYSPGYARTPQENNHEQVQ